MTALDGKDPLVDALESIEKIREAAWAGERDRMLLAKLREAVEERAAAKRLHAARIFTRILCPLDFEEQSMRALKFAARLAAQNQAELYLLHVCPELPIPRAGGAAELVMTEESAREKLEKIGARELSGIHYELLVTKGDAAERVLATQSALSADLIVVGTHNRGTFHRLLMGSVAEQILRAAPCPMLVVR